MLQLISYWLPLVVLLAGAALWMIGKKKRNDKLVGVAIGVCACVILVGVPSFIQGFVDGLLA